MNVILAKLNLVAQYASQRSDIVIAIFVVLAVAMMIIPLPTGLVDMLIGLNIGVSLLILIVAFYISHPVEYSSLPPIILLATLFRLSLSIATTRLILLQGDAGQIIFAFGNFVIAGEVLVGVVIFLIITVAQFLVITKGAERVAEVAARFVLDAMPGKQMSIDNDLRNGDIEKEEARYRRQRLEQESQLYGAMDGAMKFVKGDAIAGLVILCVNLIGGLLIGMMKRGMSFGEAINTYSLLTVGDGLIAQIPALLIAVGSGTVVTRVSSSYGHSGDLGGEITAQLGRNSRALGLTAVILLLVAFVPGFTSSVFLTLSACLGSAAYLMRRREKKLLPENNKDGASEASDSPLENSATHASEPEVPQHVVGDSGISHACEEGSSSHRVVMSLSSSLANDINIELLRQELDHMRHRVGHSLGISIPSVGLRVESALEDYFFTIDLDEVPVLKGEIPEGRALLQDDPIHLGLLGVEAFEGPALLARGLSYWIDNAAIEKLNEAGVGYQVPSHVLCLCLERTLLRYAGEFIGIQETRELLSRMEQDYSELIGEAVRAVSLQKMADVLRRLVDEGVPLRALRTILEALVTWGGVESNVVRLTERVRAALSRQICHRYARTDRVLLAWVATRQLEDAIRELLRYSEDGAFKGGLPEPMSRSLNAWFKMQLDKLDHDVDPVVVISTDVRHVLQQWIKRYELGIPVIAWQEIAPEFHMQSLGQIRLSKSTRRYDSKKESTESYRSDKPD